MLISINKQFKKKAQSTVEYAILIGIIVAAAMAMQTYIKRSLQAKQKDAADMLTSVRGNISVAAGNTAGNAVSMRLSNTYQYEPYYLVRHSKTTTTKKNISKNVSAGGAYTGTKNVTATSESAVIYENTVNAH